MKLQPVRGTRDILGDEALLFREIDHHFVSIARLYDFAEIETPIFEFTHVFKRTLGDASDIVNKEMYTFEDRSGDSLTLRPEGTASVARAAISNSLLRDLPLKFFYSGPMFRHERPQKGRYRQFRQFGIELLGVDKPLADIEVLGFAWDFFTHCQLQDKVQLELNTIGDSESRKDYLEKLVSYLSKYEGDLSEDSQTRLKQNPLRILDSKDEKDKKILESAPAFEESLNKESSQFFAEVRDGLEKLSIPYNINSRLVRGLDYYNHTVFEFTTTHLGSQNAVLSGGRYNNLIETMGGPSTPGVGWAAGTDRLALLLEQPQKRYQTVALIAADPDSQGEVLKLLKTLRSQNIPCQPIFSGNLSKQLKKAHKRQCSHGVFLGTIELKSGNVHVKDFATGEQNEVALKDLPSKLKTACLTEN
ncbi:MAG: histidine--tRNA ligase [Pseudomonadota bacterium]